MPTLLHPALPTFCTAVYGLLLLASIQTRWTTNIPEALIPSNIAQPIRQAILQQMPTTIRANIEVLGYLETSATSLALSSPVNALQNATRTSEHQLFTQA